MLFAKKKRWQKGKGKEKKVGKKKKRGFVGWNQGLLGGPGPPSPPEKKRVEKRKGLKEEKKEKKTKKVTSWKQGLIRGTFGAPRRPFGDQYEGILAGGEIS